MSKMLRIAYFVSRSTRKPHRKTEIETRNGVFRIKGTWEDEETHTRIRCRIIDRNPGWMVGGYTKGESITPILEKGTGNIAMI